MFLAARKVSIIVLIICIMPCNYDYYHFVAILVRIGVHIYSKYLCIFFVIFKFILFYL